MTQTFHPASLRAAKRILAAAKRDENEIAGILEQETQFSALAAALRRIVLQDTCAPLTVRAANGRDALALEIATAESLLESLDGNETLPEAQ